MHGKCPALLVSELWYQWTSACCLPLEPQIPIGGGNGSACRGQAHTAGTEKSL